MGTPDIFNKMAKVLGDNYEPLVSYHLNNEQKIMLKDSSAKRTCRFCGKSEPEVTFNKVAHAIPHFIGNRTLKSEYECDECNGNVFSPMESQFSQFMGIYHTFHEVSKGGKVSVYRNNSKEKSKIVVENGSIKIDCVEGEDLVSIIDKKNHTIDIKAKRSYVPQSVYKIFIKMALTIMPEQEMVHFKYTLEWLMGKRKFGYNLCLIERRYEGLRNPFGFDSCMIFKRKVDHKDNVPAYVFGLAYYNFFFQTFIPLCDEDKSLEGDVTIPYIPTPLDSEGIKFTRRHHDLSSEEKVSKEDVVQRFSYEYMEEHDYTKGKWKFALKWLFDRIVSLVGLLVLWPVLLVIATMVKVKMPGGPAFFVQKRVGKDGKLFKMYKFRSMTVGHGGSSVSVAGESRITPFGAKIRKYKLDELPELWNVLIGDMSLVGPRPDVPGYADNLDGDERRILWLRPGITGPASLKYRDEEEILAKVDNPQKYNDEVIYPDKVRINLYYHDHYSFWKDIQMIICTVLEKKMEYAGEII